MVLAASDVVFPRDSWPWTLTRDGAFVVGKGQHSREEMFDLYSSAESGPICCLVAGTLNLWSDPPMARRFAEKGLKRLNVKDFRKDYRFLLRADHPIAKHVDKIVAALGELDDDDVAYLVKTSRPKDAKYVAEGFRILRQRKGRPAIESLPEVLDAVWQKGLREAVNTCAGMPGKARALPWASPGVAATQFESRFLVTGGAGQPCVGEQTSCLLTHCCGRHTAYWQPAASWASSTGITIPPRRAARQWPFAPAPNSAENGLNRSGFSSAGPWNHRPPALSLRHGLGTPRIGPSTKKFPVITGHSFSPIWPAAGIGT